MKNKKRNIIICSSLVLLLVVALSLMLSTRMRLDSKNNSYSPARINDNTEIEPGPLGDSCTYKCPSNVTGGVVSGQYCYSGRDMGYSDQVSCEMDGRIWGASGCWESRVNAIYTCTSCDAGKYLDGITCKNCEANYYCEGGTQGRKACPSPYTVGPANNSSRDNCSITITQGYELTSTTGTPTKCPKGSYRSGKAILKYGQTVACTSCGEGFTTSSDGSTSESDCYSTGGGETQNACPDGQGMTATGCQACTGNTYSNSSTSHECQQCPSHSSPNSGHTACQCTGEYYLSGGSCVKCTDNSTPNSNHTACNCNAGYKPNAQGQCVEETNTTSCNPGGYNVNGTCIYCQSGYIATEGHPTCHINVPAGSYLVNANGSTITACPAGSYSAGAVVDWGNINSCTNCPTGQTSKIGATSQADCYDKPADNSDCTVTTSKTASIVSYNSHYNLKVSVSGHGCNGQKMNLSCTNCSISNNTYTVYDGAGYNFTVNVTINDCKEATATAILENGKSSSETVTTKKEWHQIATDVCKSDGEINGVNSRKVAEDRGVDTYYIVKQAIATCADAGKKTVDIWTRGCGSYSSSNPPSNTPSYACYANSSNIEDATAAAWTTSGSSAYPYLISGATSASECKASACYVNSDGTDYVWTTAANKPSGYTRVPGILAREKCKPEDEACYKDEDGEFHWGRFGDTAGYTLITSITSSDMCLNPPENSKCYTNGTNYVWATSAPGDGYYVVNGVTSAEECHGEETPACYLHDNEYVWGTYANNTGYTLIGSITDQEYCVKTEDACYLGPDDEYHWGDYSLDNDYSLADPSKCDVDVPTTALNINTMIYLAFAVLLSSGVILVAYVNNKKRKA